MKATGIVRRIDDLGRVVIPKEIRRTMRIREGDPLEIFVSNEGEVIFKKYSPISELGSIAAQYCEVLYLTAGFPVLITDRDHVVAVSGISRREVLERRVSHGLEDQIENRRSFSTGDGQPLQPIEGVAYRSECASALSMSCPLMLYKRMRNAFCNKKSPNLRFAQIRSCVFVCINSIIEELGSSQPSLSLPPVLR